MLLILEDQYMPGAYLVSHGIRNVILIGIEVNLFHPILFNFISRSFFSHNYESRTLANIASAIRYLTSIL